MKKYLALFLLLAFFVTPAHAFDTAPQNDQGVTVFLVPGVTGVGQLTTVPLGLEIKLAPGWHTYWRSPGEAGLPPAFDWSKSATDDGNLKSATLIYPAPKRYIAYGMETIGYVDHLVLPIDAELRTPGKPLIIDTSLDLLICSQLCVPRHFTLKLMVPAGEAKDSPEAALINEFRNRVPGDAAKSGLTVTNVSTDGETLKVDVTSQEPLQAPDLFVEDNKELSFVAPVTTIAPDKHNAQFKTKPTMPLSEDTTLAGLSYFLTVVDTGRALEQKIDRITLTEPATTTPPPSATTGPEPSPTALPPSPALPLGLVIVFAIIGGFILNLMPCVLPVLSLKILSVVSHGGGEKSVVRQSFLVTAAGILFSFLVLASMTIVLKAGGLAFGWGVQFQQPAFLALLVMLLTFFAANMWGLYDITLPRVLADNFNGPYHPKLAGDFATGALATLLATPCSAPFLGTAIGFALAGSPQDILIIFMALGFGMTLPYLAIAVWPGFATALPRPGAWMVYLRHLLGWALALTAVWLLWVLSAQITVRGAFVIGMCMIGILGLFGLRRIRPRSYLNFGIASFALLAFGTALAGTLAPQPDIVVESGWQPFDEAAITRNVAQGKTVFVDVTADWCLTCKVNEKFVLSKDEIKQRLFHGNVTAMQANWTSPDPAIVAYLQKYKRYGIPFNAVFGPGVPQGLVLPELLSTKAVMEGLDKAGQRPPDLH